MRTVLLFTVSRSIRWGSAQPAPDADPLDADPPDADPLDADP